MQNLIAPLLGGLGLFFLGVRLLSTNLVPLLGHRARANFAAALRGPVSSATGGLVAGLLTQNSTAVSWIILGLIRAGMKPTIWVLAAASWSNVGTALLPILVAVNLATAASYIIGLAGFATYFRLASSDRSRNALDATLGAALLLFGMQIVSDSVAPVREALTANGDLSIIVHAPLLLAMIGVALSLVTQSSSVAAAIAVAGMNSGLLTLPAALLLITGANLAGVLNNALKLRGETASGHVVFMLQVVQKAGGSILLLLLVMADRCFPAQAVWVAGRAGGHASGQIAVIFTLAQIAGALTASLCSKPVAAGLGRWRRPSESEAFSQPVYLLREALDDPPAALDLAMRELARLTARTPQLLDHVRANPETGAPATAALRVAGIALGDAIKQYLESLLDRHPGRNQVAAALLLENAAGNVRALYEALAELAAAAPEAADLPQAARLIEALHLLMGLVADHASGFGAEDPAFVLKLLEDRSAMMADLRERLAGQAGSAAAGDAMFRMTILFERAVWLSRRLVTELSQAHEVLLA